jgi:uncharacterized RDD family membrane protein YckC
VSTQEINSRLTVLQERAGFWWRFSGLLIDIIIICVLFQIVAIFLYAATGGLVQDGTGIIFTKCQAVTHLSIKLSPQPPAQSNFAKDCRIYSFGFETARILTVGRVTKEADVTKTVVQTYFISADGQQVDALTPNLIAMVSLFLYLIVMQARFGATLGQRIAKVHVVQRIEPQREGITFKRSVIRNLVLPAGCVPLIIVVLWTTIISGGQADAAFGGNFFLWFSLSVLFLFVWWLWILLEIAMRQDAIHDRIAGTTVLRRFIK